MGLFCQSADNHRIAALICHARALFPHLYTQVSASYLTTKRGHNEFACAAQSLCVPPIQYYINHRRGYDCPRTITVRGSVRTHPSGGPLHAPPGVTPPPHVSEREHSPTSLRSKLSDRFREEQRMRGHLLSRAQGVGLSSWWSMLFCATQFAPRQKKKVN